MVCDSGPMRVVAVALVLALAGCSGTPAAQPSAAPRSPAPSPSPEAGPTRRPTPTRSRSPGPVVVRYRIEVRTRGVASFPAVVEQTLTDSRGWSRAGFRLVRDPAARFLVVVAEGPEVDRLCRPYDTYGKYSCQNGPVVAINADRWRSATPEWTGDLAAYRTMLVNHEVGHLLGMHHPSPQCPGPGQLAPVMAQQSTELGRCRPNPWPRPGEIARAARHDLPLAPPYQR